MQPILDTLQGKRSTTEWIKLIPSILSAVDLNDDQQLDMLARGERLVTIGPTPMK